MTHHYPTRFQAKQRASKESTALIASVAYAHTIIDAASQATCYHCRIIEITKLMLHLYEDPILLAVGHTSFRKITWNKLNETEAMLLLKLQEMPARLGENNKYDMDLRTRMSNLLHLMEDIRMKYW
jgi:hypothetical protein